MQGETQKAQNSKLIPLKIIVLENEIRMVKLKCRNTKRRRFNVDVCHGLVGFNLNARKSTHNNNKILKGPTPARISSQQTCQCGCKQNLLKLNFQIATFGIIFVAKKNIKLQITRKPGLGGLQ